MKKNSFLILILFALYLSGCTKTPTTDDVTVVPTNTFEEETTLQTETTTITVPTVTTTDDKEAEIILGNPWVHTFSSGTELRTSNNKVTLSKLLWNFNYTRFNTTGNLYLSTDANKGAHIGSSNNACSSLLFETSAYEGNIATLIVNASGAAGTNAQLIAYLNDEVIETYKLTTTPTEYLFSIDNISEGTIKIEFKQTSKVAMYLKYLAINVNEIEANYTDEEKVNLISQEIIEAWQGYQTSENLILPSTHALYGGAITWKSNDETIITNAGIILGVDEETVTLTATINVNEASNEVTVDVSIVNQDTNLEVYYINVGQADCILILLPNDETMMIDAGLDYSSTLNRQDFDSWGNITYTLSQLNITKINHFVISHNHADHYEYLPNLINDYEIENIYGSGSIRYNEQFLQIIASIEEAKLVYNVVHLGDKIVDDDDLMIQVVATQEIDGDYNPNYSSVMLKLEYKDTSFLFTGDGGSYTGDAEEIALNSNLDIQADVLKAGHHGSKFSSSDTFLNAVNPQYVIMTTSAYSITGHPHIEAIQRFLDRNIKVYQSKNNGTIIFTSDGTNIHVKTEYGTYLVK